LGKFSKLRKNPVLFFQDMIAKRFKVTFVKKNKSYFKLTNNFNRFFPYTHILHSGENIAGASHLDMWIPIFNEAHISYIVFVRNYELFLYIKEKYPFIVLVYAKNKKEVDFYLNQLCCVKACFYPSNTGNNLHLLYFNEIKHIFIGHGDSDKTASAHKYFRVYDENWIAGDAHEDRFKNAGFDFSGLKQIKVGRPSLKSLIELSQSNWQNRFDGKLKLLYLSTWEGVYEEQNYTSVYIIQEIFEKIYKDFSLISVKLHPWVGKRNNILLNVSNKLEMFFINKKIDYFIAQKDIAVTELVQEANIYICDISAVITDVLSTNSPIFVYIPKDKEIKLSKSKMSYADYTYVFSNIDELVEKMTLVLNGNDYLKENRIEAMEYILGKKETLENTFVKQLKNLEE
jgi:hypothetical protein